MAGRHAWLTAGFLALATMATSVDAQTLRGRILDSESGEPVMLAYIGLLAEGQDMVVAALASAAGEFEITAPEAGGYFLYVSRQGYETLMDGVFELGDEGVFDLQVGLKPAPIELDPIDVTAGRRDVNPLEANGFYDRAVTGLGTLLIREEIERRAIDKVSDALRSIPRLDIDDSRPLTGSPDVMRNPAIWFLRGGTRCAPTLYVDRHVVATGGSRPVRLDDFTTPAEIEAIEVYIRSSEVPVGFDELSNCGVLLVWTRLR